MQWRSQQFNWSKECRLGGLDFILHEGNLYIPPQYAYGMLHVHSRIERELRDSRGPALRLDFGALAPAEQDRRSVGSRMKELIDQMLFVKPTELCCEILLDSTFDVDEQAFRTATHNINTASRHQPSRRRRVSEDSLVSIEASSARHEMRRHHHSAFPQTQYLAGRPFAQSRRIIVDE
nr:hypothetical protein CFP56_71238 [Quercus suber]